MIEVEPSRDETREGDSPASARPVPSGGGFGAASAGKIGMWVFLATDAMGFAGLLLAYAVLRARAVTWPDPAERLDRALAAALTVILLVSGATMSAAVACARGGRVRAARALVVATAVCGLAFVAGQAAEFRELASARHLGLTTDHAAALFFLITGYHGLHVLVGVVVLTVVAIFGVRRDVGVGAEAGAGALEVASLYWQFVDLVWIALFTALYLLPPVLRG